MRAVQLTAPGRAEVTVVPAPRARGGEVVVEVERAGVCGTDVELFHGTLSYVRDGSTRYPLRPGHEWCGRVRAVGTGVDRSWLGRRGVGGPEPRRGPRPRRPPRPPPPCPGPAGNGAPGRPP